MATKLVPYIKHLIYQERLEALNLPSLTYRQLRGDLSTVCSIFHNIHDLHTSQFFTFPTYSNTRGYPFKIFKQQVSQDIKDHTFSQKIVDNWNKHPHEVGSGHSTHTKPV